MSTEETKRSEETKEVEGYEAPAIESVLSAQDLEREVAYAGNNIPTRG